MKVAYLLGSLNRGGTETLMLDVCKNLRKTDFEAIAVYRKKGVLEKDFLETNIPFHFLPASKRKLKYIWQLRQLLLNNKVTIVHAQQTIDALYAYFACLGTGIKVILTLHGFDFTSSKRLHSFVLKKTTANLYVSNYQKKYYLKRYGLKDNKQFVIYNGIDFDKLKKSTDEQKKTLIREELNIPHETLLLGMVGNFNLVRNQLFICHFLSLLNKKEIDFHFIFVGKRIEGMTDRFDDCVKYCEEKNLSSKVTFMGVRNDVPTILEELDAFIYSTEHDTFGIAVIEAIATSTPVFVNDWEVMKEITEDGKLATLYQSANEEDLLNKFIVLLQNKESFVEQSQQQSLLVKEKYGIKQHILNLKNIYTKNA